MSERTQFASQDVLDEMTRLRGEIARLTRINAEDRHARMLTAGKLAAERDRAVETRENANTVSLRVEAENRRLREALTIIEEKCQDWSNDDIRDQCRWALGTDAYASPDGPSVADQNLVCVYCGQPEGQPHTRRCSVRRHGVPEWNASEKNQPSEEA